MNLLQTLGSGAVGACTLTAVHQIARELTPNAPRMDLLGERAITQSLRAFGAEPPAEDRLYRMTLAGDLLANALYYSLVGLTKPANAPLCGVALGLTAGIGAVALPGPLGLGSAPSNRTPATTAMTVGWYLLGGLAAGLAYRWLADGKNDEAHA